MADKLWPQGVPNATVPLTTGVKIGGYEPTGTGGTKNVKYDIDEIKEYAEGDLATDIAQNASDIVDNTSAIGVNSGLINGNTIDISTNASGVQANSDRLDVVEGAGSPQGVGTGDSPVFQDVETPSHASVNGALDSLDSRVDTIEADTVTKVNQGVKTTDSPSFASVKSGSSFLKWKVFSGTTNSYGQITFAHGLTGSNICGASVAIGGSNGTILRGASGTTNKFEIQYSASSIFVLDQNRPNDPIRLVVFYI